MKRHPIIRIYLSLNFALFFSTQVFAQYKLPSPDVIKQQQVEHISITKHTLPDEQVDSSLNVRKVMEKKPFLWARYWFNSAGMPDSMCNYIDGKKFRTETYVYDKKGNMTSLRVTNSKGETTLLKQSKPLAKGHTVTTIHSKSKLREITYCDKNGHVYLSKKYVNPDVFGYDSLVYSIQQKPFIATEKYYANGDVSHSLTKKWTTSPADSFHQTFFQSTTEAGRMPSYHFSFGVDDSGKVVLPPDFPFQELFANVNYQNRNLACTTIDDKLMAVMTSQTLLSKSEINELRTPKAILRHYYTFDYAYY